ncbi:protoheme IX farnesyltransferase [Athelia psychrophila]|uniref:Protoheme IX farnesyltransferase, mitochondrial n=1 Tax=Athelia psychrophila TaxID=1759441 RepID=A0A166QLY3_9AGAM|nr:protoheme IX farnesyltransferase [Fibularhizoctonia sp. CBS 109695]
MRPALPLNLCRRNILFRRPLVSLRHASTFAKPEFSSFFFHNDQWAPSARRTSLLATPKPRRITQIAAVENALAGDGTPVEGYREAQVLNARSLPKIYAQLSKSRLTTLMVLTTMGGVALSPLPTTVPLLLATAVGTTLCSASAMTMNQMAEVPFDAQMARTRMRPLVRGAVSPLHAAGFAVVTGVGGPVLLWTMVNPTTAVLGALNIALYAGAYTWMKRKHVANTWVGAIVGGIPPLMGWTACGGHLIPSADHPIHFFLPQFLSTVQSVPLDLAMIDNPLSPFALFMLLFSWQFPHFNSLSYVVRGSYAQAGCKMLSVTNPQHNALVGLRHAALLFPICSILFPLSGLTTWAFALTSLLPNAICTRAAWIFWKSGSEKQARLVFQHSLWYLPVILGLMMVHKQGMDWGKWFGLEKEEAKKELS